MKTSFFYANEESELQIYLASKNYQQIVCIADAHTNGFCMPIVKKIFPFLQTTAQIIIPEGEQNKNISTCIYVWHEMEKMQLEKNTLLVCVGGGMLSDLAGFVASTYKRGIDTMLIPTTLLSMVDACIGGKTAIDFSGNKNNIGTYHLPIACYVHPIFLHTLPERILQSGIGEMMKHALLSSTDKWHTYRTLKIEDFYSKEKIRESVEFKNNIVEQDLHDASLRQSLNFAHSIAHAIESYSLQGAIPLYHGEAVLLGIRHELILSHLIFQLPHSIIFDYEQWLKQCFPELHFNYTLADIQSFLQHDKKNRDGYRMSLLKEIGVCETQVRVSEAQLQESFKLF